ncbi:hypothetical protein BU17DRAFT_101530 [Hysterangium stoloniferum]|nr:hypothetical protein BU17DRAFT_101530 [Hysterangium stoloniferum]
MLADSSSSAFYDIVGPKDVLAQSLGTPAELWRRNSHRVNDSPPGPYDGRTVEINSGDNLTAAWGKLNALLRANNVRQELRRTARHEQKGEKRRRLRSERWRRKFADEVRKKVKLVIEMRNRDRMWGAKH